MQATGNLPRVGEFRKFQLLLGETFVSKTKQQPQKMTKKPLRYLTKLPNFKPSSVAFHLFLGGGNNLSTSKIKRKSQLCDFEGIDSSGALQLSSGTLGFDKSWRRFPPSPTATMDHRLVMFLKWFDTERYGNWTQTFKQCLQRSSCFWRVSLILKIFNNQNVGKRPHIAISKTIPNKKKQPL